MSTSSNSSLSHTDRISINLQNDITAQTTPNLSMSSLRASSMVSGNLEKLSHSTSTPDTLTTSIEVVDAHESSLSPGKNALDSDAMPLPGDTQTLLTSKNLRADDEEFWSSPTARLEVIEYITTLKASVCSCKLPTVPDNPARDPTQPESAGSQSIALTGPESKELTIGWELKVCYERRVEDSLGLPGLPQPDIGELDQQENPTALPSSGPILKKTREFTQQHEHIRTTIEIRSQLLTKALREVLSAEQNPDYANFYKDQVIIEEPYTALFQYWSKIEGKIDSSADESKEHLKFLLETMEVECPTSARLAKSLRNNPKGNTFTVPFQALPVVYCPGTTVYNQKDNEWAAYIVDSVMEGHTNPEGSFEPIKLILRSYMAGSDGKGIVETYSEAIIQFKNETNIGELDYVPAGFLQDEEQRRQDLMERGLRYEELMKGTHTMEYRGAEWNKTYEEDTVRVIIDGDSEIRMPVTKEELLNLGGLPPQPRTKVLPGCRCPMCQKARAPRYDNPFEPYPAYSSPHHNLRSVPAGVENRLYLPSTVSAFSLVRKTWGLVKINDLGEPDFQEDMMQKKLVISPTHRDIVESLVDTYKKKDLRFGDFVKGKGRGLVILLHGSPGTGKTLTAECVAEQAKRPLYAITCGDLGVDSMKLETELRTIFDRATRWNAVLLLDEADVFLQERDVRDLGRNALVSVFLRELEYFDGILFLTTNRPGQLDEAFQSRIHITLSMPTLNADAQLKVWNTFLIDMIDKKDARLQCLRRIKRETKETPLNGRQIRNCVLSAVSMATQRDQVVSFEHIEKVLNLTRDFNRYMEELHGHTGNERQHFMGSRAK